MPQKGRQDPRLETPGPEKPQADDGGLSRGLHRQSVHIDDPGHLSHGRIHGDGPSRRAIDGFKRERLIDRRVENCTGLLQDGNCDGDPYWMPPNGAWYNWPGIGGTASNRTGGTIMGQANPGNPENLSFSTGQETTDTDLINWRVPIRTAYVTVSDTELETVKQRSITGFGHGTEGLSDANYNCYSNCDCNCACVCQCTSNCACFPAGTPVTMANGYQQDIAELQPGDLVRGAFGHVNRVDEIFVGKIGGSPAFLINDKYFAAGPHRIWSIDRGWVAGDPSSWYTAMKQPGALDRFAKIHGVDEPPRDGIYAPKSERPKQMVVGDRLAWGSLDQWLTVTSITPLRHDGRLTLYEPICHNGSGSYEVHGGLWAVAGPDYAFPFQNYVETENASDVRPHP